MNKTHVPDLCFNLQTACFTTLILSQYLTCVTIFEGGSQFRSCARFERFTVLSFQETAPFFAGLHGDTNVETAMECNYSVHTPFYDVKQLKIW